MSEVAVYVCTIMTEREELSSFISDVYKDIHGFRPRFYDYNNMSIEELRAVADRLSEEARYEMMEHDARVEARKQMVAFANHHPHGTVTTHFSYTTYQDEEYGYINIPETTTLGDLFREALNA